MRKGWRRRRLGGPDNGGDFCEEPMAPSKFLQGLNRKL